MSKPSLHLSIAIIGGGFSGTMVAAHLLRHAHHPLTITLIERKPTVGQGAAYSTPFDCHVLNVPAAKMSAFPDVPDHFVCWLQSQTDVAAPDAAATFASRKHYGEYLQSVLAEAEAKAPQFVRFERVVNDEAAAIYPQGSGAIVRLQSGFTIWADRVVLALGNVAPNDLAVADRAFYLSDRYINSWSTRSLQSLSPDQSVLFVGSGLTTLDWVTALHNRGHRGAMHVVSRRGLLPQPHRSVAPYGATISQEQRPKTVLGLLRQVRQEVKTAAAQGQDWRGVIDALRPQTQNIWRSLSLQEQRRFLRHLRPYWDTHRHRVAPYIADIVSNLLKSGQMTLYAGRIQSYREHNAGVEVTICPRGCDEAIALTVDLVVNCTGPNCNYRKIQHPLIVNLLQTNLIQPDPLALGLNVAENGALINADGIVSDWLYTLGSPKRGYLWETTAVAELRMQAIALAQELLAPRSSYYSYPYSSTLNSQSLISSSSY